MGRDRDNFLRREQDMFFVVKRDGEIVEFQLEKITVAIKKITPPIVGVPAFFKWDCTPSTLSV